MKGLIFVYALTYGGAIVSLLRPWYGLLIYVCFAIIRPESLWHWAFQGSGGNFSRITAIALLLGWVLNGLGQWNFAYSKATICALVGFWSWAAVSTLVAADYPEESFGFLESTAKIILPFLVGVTLIQTEKQVRQLAWVILLSQGYLAWELNLSYFQGFNILDAHVGPGGFGGMDNNCVAIAMVTGAGLAFFMGMHYTGWRRWLAFLCAGLMAHTIMFAFSRGGMLALIVLGLVTFLLMDKRPAHLLFFALAVAVALSLAGPEVRDRFLKTFASEEERDESAQSRIDMWKQCLVLVQENPIFGVGPDNWGYQAEGRFGWGTRKEAHSLWMQTAAEMGIVGVGLLLGFYGFTMLRLWPIARRHRPANEWDVAIARMTIASITGFMVSAQFVSLEGLELPYYVTLLGAGTLKLFSLKTSGSQVPSPVNFVQLTPGRAVSRTAAI